MTSTADRDALVLRYADYARSLALEVARGLPGFLSRDDLISAGHEGLVDAAGRFDPTRGAQFTTFAYYRVRGAVMDYVRKSAQSEPRLRARASAQAALDALAEDASARRVRGVSDSAVDAAESLASVLDAAAVVFTVTECAEAVSSHDPPLDADEALARKEQLALVNARLDRLPEKERQMIKLVYFEGHTIEEAGLTFGLSKSWSSRLHARALSLLRAEVGEAP